MKCCNDWSCPCDTMPDEALYPELFEDDCEPGEPDYEAILADRAAGRRDDIAMDHPEPVNPTGMPIR